MNRLSWSLSKFLLIIGTIISKRRGEIVTMDEKNSMTTMEWHVPTRGLLGYRSEFINDTHGEGTMVRQFHDYEEVQGQYR